MRAQFGLTCFVSPHEGAPLLATMRCLTPALHALSAAATPVSYLAGEDVVLYNGLGPIKVLVPTTNKLNALANYQ